VVQILTTATVTNQVCDVRIIIASDRRPESKQRIEGKIDRFRLGRVRVRDRVRVRYN